MCSVKRDNGSLVISRKNIILDIEGTTTSITFVKDVLFPYVRKHLNAYIKDNWDSESVQAIVNALRIQASEDKEKKLEGVVEIPKDGEKDVLIEAVIGNVIWQMDRDSKAKSLKDLQGLIMETGYKKGEIKGHVYEDFEPSLKLWTQLEKCVYIYSSGSVHAQKLLYGHSEKGDLLPHIKGHFDTTVGKKGDAESYKKILEEIASTPSETVFFTDVPQEARAAKESGMLAILVSREGNAPLSDEDRAEFQVISSFSEVVFENNSKKRKVCIENDENNDNKSLESCEVSLKPPKEPTNTSLPQQNDVEMEVEESTVEEKVCDAVKSDGKHTSENLEDKTQQPNGEIENGDTQMKTEKEVVEENVNGKDIEIVGTQTNKDIHQSELATEALSPEKIKTEGGEQKNEKSEVKCDEPNTVSDKMQEELKHNTDDRKLEIKKDEATDADNKDLNLATISEQKTQVSMIENCQLNQQNSELEGLDAQNKPNKEIEMKEVTEKQIALETLKPESNVGKIDQPTPDTSNEGVVIEKNQSSQPNQGSCLKDVENSDDGTLKEVTSNKSGNEIQDENAVTDVKTESTKESPVISQSEVDQKTMDCDSNVEVHAAPLKGEGEEIKAAEEKTEENQQEEKSLEINKQNGTEIANSKTNVTDSNDKTLSTNKPENNESNSGQAQSEVKMDDVSNESRKVNGNEETSDKLCTASDKQSKPDDSVSTQVDTDVDMKAVSDKNGQQDNAEQTDGKSQNSDGTDNEKESNGNVDTKEDGAELKSNGEKIQSDNLNGKDEEMSINGKMVDEAKSVMNSDDNDLGKKVDETGVCEVKKVDLPENSTIAAVVEA